MGSLKHEPLTESIIGVFFDVYNELGPGYLESVYENAMVIALEEKGLRCEQQRPIKVKFRGCVVGDFRADIVVEKCVLIDLKAADSIGRAHVAQSINYLKATGIEVGLILNFGPAPKIKRVILDSF